jgi:hypothetical protein
MSFKRSSEIAPGSSLWPAACSRLLFFATCLLAGLGICATPTAAQEKRRQAESRDMRLVGYNDLQGRSGYHPVIIQQGGRWIAYVGHHGGKGLNPLTGVVESNGTAVLDVTDPRAPRYLAHIPGEEGEGENGGAQMVRACSGSELPKGDRGKTYLLRTFGNSAQEIWDVTVPERPAILTTIERNLRHTHKNWWECDTGIAYLVSGISGWRVRRMTQVYDLSDPARPVHIRDFGIPGQEPGTSGTPPTELHGGVSTGPRGNRIYFGYGTNKGGILQIVDREKLLIGPREPTPENLAFPEIGRLEMSPLVGAHTVIPLGDMKIAEFAKDKAGSTRNMVMIVDESLVNECQAAETRQIVWFVDATVERKPMPVSNFYVPESPGNFCSRGGRFGAHSSNEATDPVYYQKVAFVTFFNAGVRAIDIRNPYQPKEIAYFIPAITEATNQRCIKVDGQDRCKVAIQSNNVETDDRGYIYVADRANTGLHILELTGEARKAAGLP